MSRTVLITGSSRGIGAATAKLFSAHGYQVVINYNRSHDAALQVSKSCSNSMTICADISSRAAVDAMFSEVENQFGDIDILINNAGISQQCLFTDVTESMWNKMLGTNLNGAFYCCQRALPSMINRKCGKIINISSIWGMVGASCEVAYSITKAGIIGLTRALAKEVGPSGIQVNCVAPGIIETDMLCDFDYDTKQELAYETPLGVLGSPSDIAQTILFLASDAANFITGQVISPNGGYVI